MKTHQLLRRLLPLRRHFIRLCSRNGHIYGLSRPVRPMSQLPFANRADMIKMLVALVAEQHRPADQAYEALHEAEFESQ